MKVLLPIALMLLLNLSSYGQTDSAKGLEIGLTASTGLSMYIGSVPEDLSNLPCPAFSVGLLNIKIPTQNPDFSILVGLTYDMRAFLFEDAFDRRQTIQLHYLSLPAGLKWQRFFMAASVGLSLRSHQTTEPDTILFTTEQNPDPIIISTGSIDLGGIFLELRAGALIPVLYHGKNHLDVVVQGTINTFGRDGFTSISLLNPGDRVEGPSYMASALIGATYFFSF